MEPTQYAPDTEPTADTTAAPFTIDSEERACWLLRKLANLDAEEARIKAQAAAMLAQVRTDRESLNHRFGSELEAWARQEIEHKGGKRKSLHTLQGTLAFRTSPARLVVSDNDAALVRAHALHLTTATICTGAYLDAAKKELEATGELLPGVEVLDARETFSVKFKGDATGDSTDE